MLCKASQTMIGKLFCYDIGGVTNGSVHSAFLIQDTKQITKLNFTINNKYIWIAIFFFVFVVAI